MIGQDAVEKRSAREDVSRAVGVDVSGETRRGVGRDGANHGCVGLHARERDGGTASRASGEGERARPRANRRRGRDASERAERAEDARFGRARRLSSANRRARAATRAGMRAHQHLHARARFVRARKRRGDGVRFARRGFEQSVRVFGVNAEDARGRVSSGRDDAETHRRVSREIIHDDTAVRERRDIERRAPRGRVRVGRALRAEPPTSRRPDGFHAKTQHARALARVVRNQRVR